MADIRINQLPEASGGTAPVASDNVAIDGDTTRRTTIQKLVDAGAPVASQAEAEAGTNNVKRMTPLTVKQSIASEVGVSIASKSQGDLASSAVQPGAALVAALEAILSSLPTSLPASPGKLWNNGGLLSIS